MRRLTMLGLIAGLGGCTETATVEVLEIRSAPGQFFEAGLTIHGDVDGDERLLALKIDGAYVMTDGDLEPVRVSSRGGIGFAMAPAEHVIELEDDREGGAGTVLRTSPIALRAGSNHVVFHGDLAQLRHVAHFDAPHVERETTTARVTNTLRSRLPLDVLVCEDEAVPPGAGCETVLAGLAYGETWEAVVPVDTRVHARPPRPESYVGASDLTFMFTPNHRFNGAPEDETPCTRSTRGSLYPFGWGEDDCEDPWSPSSLCLQGFEPHDNAFGSLPDPNACDVP